MIFFLLVVDIKKYFFLYCLVRILKLVIHPHKNFFFINYVTFLYRYSVIIITYVCLLISIHTFHIIYYSLQEDFFKKISEERNLKKNFFGNASFQTKVKMYTAS